MYSLFLWDKDLKVFHLNSHIIFTRNVTVFWSLCKKNSEVFLFSLL